MSKLANILDLTDYLVLKVADFNLAISLVLNQQNLSEYEQEMSQSTMAPRESKSTTTTT